MPGLSEHALYLLFTPSLCAGDPWSTLDDAIQGGVDLVQWRPKRDDPEGAKRCLEACARHGVPVIVNDDVELAVRLHAAGAHVGQHDTPVTAARRILLPGQWLGVSTHDLYEVRHALDGGADHLGFGPMFPTATKGYDTGQPDGALEATLGAAGAAPVFAIGGITRDNIRRVIAAGCRRVAVGSAILAAAAPAHAAAALRRALDD